MGLAATTNRIGSSELNENADFTWKGILQLRGPFVIVHKSFIQHDLL